MPPEQMNPLNYIQFGMILFLMVIIALWRERAHKSERRIVVNSWLYASSLSKASKLGATLVLKELDMTVKDLEVAKEIVQEDPEGVAAVYEYNHAITNEKLYSVESIVNKGSTERSGYVINPRLIYTPENGWSI